MDGAPGEQSQNIDQTPQVPEGSPCLQGERVSFTGTLASMTHRQALEIVEQQGGVPQQHVSRQTTMLVVGEEGWPLEPDGQPSQKLEQVEAWRQSGSDIRVLSESDWLYLVGLGHRRQEVHRLYTPAMLSQMLEVPVSTIRGWERAGLLRPVRKVYRLPYFDFQEAAGARRLNELLAAGVSRQQIEVSLSKLRGLVGDVERSLAQLEVLARDARLLYRDERGLLEPTSGQRVFDFESEPDDAAGDADETTSLPLPSSPSHDARERWSAEEWFREGCRLLDEGEAASAVEAFRLCLMERPGDPELNFHLAEALYRGGKLEGAIERYYAAVEADHNYLEAWTQLGCLLDEQGNLEAALEAFQLALGVFADYPDALWHTADVLDRLGRGDEAVEFWTRYLEFDSRGPWAEHARQRLGEGTGTVPASGAESSSG